MIKREIISRESKFYKFIRFRWLFYLLILGFFMQRLFLAGIIKNKLQKDLFTEIEKNSEIIFYYKPPTWINKIPSFAQPFFENWGTSEVDFYKNNSETLFYLNEFLFFDNITSLSIGGLDEDFPNSIIKNEYQNAILNTLSNISSLKSLKINIKSINKEHINGLKKLSLKSLSIYADSFEDGSITALRMLKSLKNLNLTGIVKFPFNELRNLDNLNIETLYISAGYSTPSRIKNGFSSEVHHLPKLSNLTSLDFPSSLSALLKNIDKFPQLHLLYPGDYEVYNDNDIDKLVERKGLGIGLLEVGPAVSLEGVENLKNLPNLKILDLTLCDFVLDIDFSELNNIRSLILPDYFDLKEFLSKKNIPKNLKTICSPGSSIDLETAKELNSQSKILLVKAENEISAEADIHLTNNSLFYHSRMKSDPRKRYCNSGFYLNRFTNKKVSQTRVLDEASLQNLILNFNGPSFLRFNNFSKKSAEILLNSKNMSDLTIEMNSGFENLILFKDHKELKKLKIILFSPPKAPVELANIENLSLVLFCDTRFDQLIVSESMNKIKTLRIDSQRASEAFELSSMEKLKSLKELELIGSFSFNGTSTKLNLDVLEYYSDSCKILENISASETAEYFLINLTSTNKPKYFKALKGYAAKITDLDLSCYDLDIDDYDLLTTFTNLESLVLPYGERRITLKSLKGILKLPKLSSLDLGNIKLSRKEFNQLTVDEKEKLNFD